MAWNRSSNDGRARSPSAPRRAGTARPIVRGAIAGVIVVLGAAVAAWWLWPTGDSAGETAVPQARQRIKEVASAQRGEAPRPQDEKPAAEAQPTNLTDRAKMLWRGKPVKTWNVVTNGVRVEQLIVTADGLRYKMIRELDVLPTGTDQLLAMALSDRNGGGAPMPGGDSKQLDKQFLESLKKPIVINPDDSEAVRNVKEAVAAAREEMAELLKSGRSFSEVLAEAKQVNKENHETRTKAMAEYNEILRSGDKEAAEQYLFKVNLALQQMGIEEIPASGIDNLDKIEKIIKERQK